MQRLLVFGMIFLFVIVPAVHAQVPQPWEAEARAAVEIYVRQKTAALGYEVRVKRFSFSGAVSLPAGNINYEIVAPQQWEGWGNANIALIARQGDKVVGNIPARVEVEALAEMVIAVRQIDHGSIVTLQDVALKTLDISMTQGRFLSSTSEVIGKKVRSTIRPNTPFKADQLEKVALIKSGQIVTIVAENDRMRVTMTGKTKSSGGEGDMINVQNMNSLKEFPARIVDANTVLVAF